MNNTNSKPNQTIAIAALIVLITAASVTGYYMVFKKNEATDVFASSFTAYPNTLSPASRSAETAEVGHLQQIMGLYENKDYKSLVKQISSYLSGNQSDYQLKFYRGIAYLELNEPGKAIADFEEVLLANADLKDQSKWYLGLSYLKVNDNIKAGEIFNDITKSGNSYSDKAKQIMTDLNFTPAAKREKYYQITDEGRYEFYYWKETNPVQHPVTERTLYLETSRQGLIPGDVSYTDFTNMSVEEKKNLLAESQQDILTAMQNSKRDFYNEIKNAQQQPDLSALAMLEQEKLELLRQEQQRLQEAALTTQAAMQENATAPVEEVIAETASAEIATEVAQPSVPKEPTYEQPKKLPDEMRLPWIIDAMLRAQTGKKLPEEFDFERINKEEESSWIVEAVTNPSFENK